MPAGKLLTLGVWEGSKFVGCVIFGRGANRNIGKPFSLSQTEVCELVRIALRRHKSPVSRIISYALKLLKQSCPGMQVVISYADPEQGHLGVVYQASNWCYLGTSSPQSGVLIGSKALHKKSASRRFGTVKGLNRGKVTYKHKYAYPLRRESRKLLTRMAEPYPDRL